MRDGAEIHQAIHGYAEGHTLLASSIRLDKRDARTMLVLSDLAGSGGIIGEEGYITGYPLPVSGYYVLAKTWLAPEMRRPGCVWTHSLIIKADRLDAIARHAFPDELFARPEAGFYEPYKVPLSRRLHGKAVTPIRPAQEALVRSILSALYAHPTKGVFFTDADQSATAIVTGVWSQQWTALKARFRFCTSVAADRSADGLQFDLQVTRKGLRNPASVLKSSLDVRKLRITQAPWLDPAVDDLIGSSSELSTFFDECGPVLVEGREAFVPLATLFCFLRGAPSVPQDEAMETLEHPAVGSLPDRIRLGVIRRAVLAADDASSRAVAAFLDRLDLFDSAERKEAARRLGHRLVRTERGRLLAMAEGTPGEMDFASQVIDLASTRNLVEAAIDDASFARTLLDRRRDLLADSRFVSNYPDVGALLSLAGQLDDAGKEVVIGALLRSGRSDVDVRRLRRVDGRAFWKVLKDLARGGELPDRLYASNLVRQLCDDIGLITSDLSAGLVTSAPALEAICHATWPDQIFNDYGADPWLAALEGLPKDETFGDKTFVMAFSFCRALGWRTRQPIELAALALPGIYEVAKRGALPPAARSMLDNKLPGSYVHRWDMCKRLRRAVSDLFIDKRGSPSVYLHLLEDDGDFVALVEETADRYGGRTFLKDVRRHLKCVDRPEKLKLKIVELALD
ncbi:hypothetical protein SAMN05216360_102215 [Methylobacterium phyllostachyos]|uniref:Uncharacterized protein n=1 Tax=Methylobacterium phyllostachyos TaxID=582672 RepID=A0A1G9TJV5_9HYPH|nr:hypothetical protein [Methylobacterium phyllostachyos]SDM48069.1 hypothetical protein SAMN05216360_102215 [Methylobacterium phyllostachyos]